MTNPVSLSPSPKLQFFDDNGDPLVGGKLYTYQAGTTAIDANKLNTYTESTGTTANTNPIILDSRGEPPSGGIFLLPQSYKFVLKDSADVEIWTMDYIDGVGGATAAVKSAYGVTSLTSFTTTELSGITGIINLIGSTPTNLVIDRDLTCIANATIPDSLNLVFLPTGKITVSTGKTLTINSSPQLGLTQAFVCVGTGAVAFGDGAVEVVYPEWWGADHTGVAESHAAIQAAIDTGRNVALAPEGLYLLDTTITISTRFQQFDGNGATLSYSSGSGTAVVVNGESSPAYRMKCVLKNFDLIATTPGANVGVKAEEGAEISLDNIRIYSFATGLWLYGVLISDFHRITIQESTTVGLLIETGAVIPSPANLISFNDCRIIGSVLQAISCTQGALITFNSCEFEENGGPGNTENICEFLDMGTIGVQPAVVFNSCWFESNVGASELYYRGYDTNSGITTNDCSFYSTEVDYNIDLDSGVCSVCNCGLSATGPTKNVLLGSSMHGHILSSNIRSYTNNSSTVLMFLPKTGTVETQLAFKAGNGLRIYRTGNSGDKWTINNAGSGDRLDVYSDNAADQVFFQNTVKVAGTFDASKILMGSYYLWVDTSGRLRIKDGAPSSATDGTVVGTQS